jgi:hypothetical protein
MRLLTLALSLTLALAGCSSQTAQQAPQAEAHAHAQVVPGSSLETPPLAAPLDPSRGAEIGTSFEAFLSPHQEPGEEKDTPALTPKAFLSTAPSLLRQERKSKGHGMLRFTRDLSRAYVDVQLEGVNPDDVVMFHIHCGRPDMLGPIMVDLALTGDLQENLRDGRFTAEIRNPHIEATSGAGHGPVAAFLNGCPIVPGIPGDAKTVAGMEHIARQGELYFNLHTKGQTFYGDIRGQLRPVP